MISVDYGRVYYPVGRGYIKMIAETAGRIEKKISGAVEISVIGDREMKEINKKWRKKNSSTDVLSFAWNEDKRAKSVILGQILISHPFVKKQAKEAGVPFKKEFARVLVHGLLHLVGYDHNNRKKAEKMFNLQEKILNKIK